MTKKLLILIVNILIILFSFQTVLAKENFNRDEFQYMSDQSVQLNNDSFFILELNPSLFNTLKPNLEDLRLTANNEELGYTRVSSSTEEEPQVTWTLEILNKGDYQNGEYSFVAIIPDTYKKENKNKMMIDLSTKPYLVKGKLYGSNDNLSWQELKQVTLFSINGHKNEISISDIDYKYLKINFKQPSDNQLTVNSVSLLSERKIVNNDGSTLNKMDVEVNNKDKENETDVIVDLNYKNRISSEVILNTNNKGFYRKIVLEGSNDKEKWQYIDSSYIYKEMDDTAEKLSLNYVPTSKRYLRIRIMNEDNQPITVDSVNVRIHPVRVIVKVPSNVKSSVNLKAYWGHPSIQSPSYDVAQLVSESDYLEYKIVKLNDYNTNPSYHLIKEQKPFTERYPFMLPLGLSIAALIVAYMLYRNVKQMKNE